MTKKSILLFLMIISFYGLIFALTFSGSVLDTSDDDALDEDFFDDKFGNLNNRVNAVETAVDTTTVISSLLYNINEATGAEKRARENQDFAIGTSSSNSAYNLGQSTGTILSTVNALGVSTNTISGTVYNLGVSTRAIADRSYATEQATGTISTSVYNLQQATGTLEGLVHDMGISTAANSSNIYNLGISTRTNSDDIYSVRQSTADFVKNNSSGTLNGGLILNGNCTFYHDIYFADGTTMNTAATGGGGADDVAREVKITLGHSGLAYPTHDISTTETYQNSIYVDSITASVDVLAATTDLVYFIKLSSPSSPQDYNAWMVFSGSITVPIAYYHYITTSVFSGWGSRIIPAGTRISLGVQKCDGTSPGGSWGRVTIYGTKRD